MGEDAERDERLAAFAGFTVDATLLAAADPDAVVLASRRTRARRSPPTSSTAPRSAVWDEAENRLHTTKAVLALVTA